ncbi:hypothetical protein MLD38_016700 [Melastoma candidum]|uniref:Uncharacterized protein n=1 Tax=Melastoma candidum TaxID=119954 RepID=A0ACB9QN95_9MYRT|nr:hypothetical protein MLD38_016700 [Melastoma candidum]
MYPFWNHANGNYVDMAATYASDAVPQHGAGYFPSIPDVQFTSMTTCPKNYIVFDQTNQESRIMFHPSLVPKVGTSYLQPPQTSYGENLQMKGVFGEREKSFSYEEDSADIDALLGSEIEGEGGEEDYDDDEVSTARTNGNYDCYSPDSCSIGQASQHVNLDDSCSGNEMKEQKIQEMVKVLRGIVPGGKQMSTATLLDEAVRYLKVMKIEAAELGDLND